MPIKLINYKNAQIYKISRKDGHTDHEYYGSTCNIRKRRNTHKSDCTNIKSEKYNYKVYQHIRNNGGWGNWNIYFIENFPCKSKQELKIRERYWIELLKPTLNSNIPGRSDSESKKYWNQNNQLKIKQYNILRKKKITCPCGSIVSKKYMCKHIKNKIHIKKLLEKQNEAII